MTTKTKTRWTPPPIVRTCRGCGCTDQDCSGCVARTGVPCWWVDVDLCSACAMFSIANFTASDRMYRQALEEGLL